MRDCRALPIEGLMKEILEILRKEKAQTANSSRDALHKIFGNYSNIVFFRFPIYLQSVYIQIQSANCVLRSEGG
jgi:hypothetical protein